ncbi:hypothetical protein GOBAR_DD14467 [Gossypium barbadense]|nr:hypothetical protein GOBAR_DD14467 [Gossypium barbadense]
MTMLMAYCFKATFFDEGVRSLKRKQLEEKLLQLAQPAHQAILGHLRSGTLEKFKEAFEKALNGGEKFSVAARNCTESYMALFDEGYQGLSGSKEVIEGLRVNSYYEKKLQIRVHLLIDAFVELANWDSSKVREKLRRDIDAHVASVQAAKLAELTSSYEVRSLNPIKSGTLTLLTLVSCRTPINRTFKSFNKTEVANKCLPIV